MSKYKMMTAKEAIDYLVVAKDKSFDFTFDRLDLDPDVDVCGWYGVKIVNIFDESPYGYFVMCYWGGGSTEGYDIYGCVDNADDMAEVKEFMTDKLQAFMNRWCDWSNLGEVCKKVCVEIKED